MTLTYDVAQVCLNGHMVTDRLQSRPEMARNFCSQCGAQTISACQGCKESIPGALISTTTVGSYYMRRPPRVQQFAVRDGAVAGFCHGCGKPYPWTASAVTAAKTLADELEELTDAEKLLLRGSIDDLVSDNPQTSVAVLRFKRLMPKIGKHAAEGFKDILINVLSEAVRKQLWP